MPVGCERCRPWASSESPLASQPDRTVLIDPSTFNVDCEPVVSACPPPICLPTQPRFASLGWLGKTVRDGYHVGGDDGRKAPRGSSKRRRRAAHLRQTYLAYELNEYVSIRYVRVTFYLPSAASILPPAERRQSPGVGVSATK